MDKLPAWWDEKFDNHGEYMASYGEGVGSETRKIIFQYIGSDESLLDAGCGPGWNYEHGRMIENWTGAYKGTDYSTKFIEACVAKYGNSAACEWEVQDARAMTERDASWDVVLLQDIVEHTNGYKDPVLEALRVARNRVIVSFWRKLSDSDEDDIKLSDEGLDGYGSSYSKPKLEAFLKDLGYHYIIIENNGNRFHEFLIIFKNGAVINREAQ